TTEIRNTPWLGAESLMFISGPLASQGAIMHRFRCAARARALPERPPECHDNRELGMLKGPKVTGRAK
ncbi:MAG: hypothetical protein ACR2PM_06780, partial [Hyphomicrobiales bacterium]